MMRILYVGSLRSHESSLYRRDALLRLGHEVSSVDTAPCHFAGGRLGRALRTRLLAGPAVASLNRSVLGAASRMRPQLIWFDKPVFLRPDTIRGLRQMGALTVEFCIDNPFGPRGDPGWRLLRRAVPFYDVHLVQRDSNLADYLAAGAKDVRIFRTAYERTVHFPPPAGWSDADRTEEVVFIGAPYDDRPAFLAVLAERFNIPLKIWGSPQWAPAAPALY